MATTEANHSLEIRYLSEEIFLPELTEIRAEANGRAGEQSTPPPGGKFYSLVGILVI